ncbi:hypothetical protein D3C80_1436020 [compost metagenome]
MHVVAPEDALQGVEHQDQAEGQQHLVEVVALVQRLHQEALDQHAEADGQRHGEEDGEEQVADQRGQPPGQVGADHVQGAVGQVDDVHDAEDQRETAGDQKQQQPVLQTVHGLDENAGQLHGDISTRWMTEARAPAARGGNGRCPGRTRLL